jgi:flagellar motor switch protein FliN
MDQSEIDALMRGVDGGGEASGGELGVKASSSTDDDQLSWDDVTEEMEKSQTHIPSQSVAPSAEVILPHFEEMVKRPSTGPKVDLDFVLDIPLTINVELGRNRMLIGELLQLGQGSVIELTKLAGEPMDIYVNNRLIAKGEVVVVNEKFGVRLTDIVSPAERVNRLK